VQCSALISYSCILQHCHLSGTCVSYATVNLLNKYKNKKYPKLKSGYNRALEVERG